MTARGTKTLQELAEIVASRATRLNECFTPSLREKSTPPKLHAPETSYSQEIRKVQGELSEALQEMHAIILGPEALLLSQCLHGVRSSSQAEGPPLTSHRFTGLIHFARYTLSGFHFTSHWTAPSLTAHLLRVFTWKRTSYVVYLLMPTPCTCSAKLQKAMWRTAQLHDFSLPTKKPWLGLDTLWKMCFLAARAKVRPC